MPSDAVKLQGKILLRAWEGGAFEDLAERHRAVGVHNVSTATQSDLDEFVEVTKAVGERIASLLGEPLRKGVCSYLSGWGYGDWKAVGSEMVYALGLRHHESVHVRAFGPKELATSPRKGGDRRRLRGRGRR